MALMGDAHYSLPKFRQKQATRPPRALMPLSFAAPRSVNADGGAQEPGFRFMPTHFPHEP